MHSNASRAMRSRHAMLDMGSARLSFVNNVALCCCCIRFLLRVCRIPSTRTPYATHAVPLSRVFDIACFHVTGFVVVDAALTCEHCCCFRFLAP